MNGRERADNLVARIASGEGTGPDEYALLQEVFAGYPINGLKPLVESAELRIARVAATILAEAGAATVEGPGLLDTLLEHDDPKVRYYAIQAVLGSGSPILARQTAKSIKLLDDEESPVRWSALRLVSYAPDRQLETALAFLDESWVKSVSSLLTYGGPADRREISGRGGEPTQWLLLLELAAAIRHSGSSLGHLERLAKGPDSEIREFARQELGQLG